ncbi:hypothetical protein J6590_053405 [Homalodisca vitripennis]|nr:hypothetical protein J6590_053405 [Homalodisca vitripennis]
MLSKGEPSNSEQALKVQGGRPSSAAHLLPINLTAEFDNNAARRLRLPRILGQSVGSVHYGALELEVDSIRLLLHDLTDVLSPCLRHTSDLQAIAPGVLLACGNLPLQHNDRFLQNYSFTAKLLLRVLTIFKRLSVDLDLTHRTAPLLTSNLLTQQLLILIAQDIRQLCGNETIRRAVASARTTLSSCHARNAHKLRIFSTSANMKLTALIRHLVTHIDWSLGFSDVDGGTGDYSGVIQTR